MTRLTHDELARLDACWRAANHLSVGQSYLLDDPLLREPLRLEHVEPRLLGHWGTPPGLNFIDAHLNRLVTVHDADVLFAAGPGHGGPAVVANTYLEGTCSELYPEIGEDETVLPLVTHEQHNFERGEDLPEGRDWTWSGA